MGKVSRRKVGARTGDFLVDGARTELKTLSATAKATAENVKSRIIDGVGQAENVLVDATANAGVTLDVAVEAAKAALGASQKLQKVEVLLADGRVVTVSRKP